MFGLSVGNFEERSSKLAIPINVRLELALLAKAKREVRRLVCARWSISSRTSKLHHIMRCVFSWWIALTKARLLLVE